MPTPAVSFEQDGKMKQKTQFTFPIDAFQRRYFKALSGCVHFSIFYANEWISVAYLVSEPAQGSKSSLWRSVSLTLLFFEPSYALSTAGNLTALFSGGWEFVNLVVMANELSRIVLFLSKSLLRSTFFPLLLSREHIAPHRVSYTCVLFLYTTINQK